MVAYVWFGRPEGFVTLEAIWELFTGRFVGMARKMARHSTAHPGFAAVQRRIEGEGYSAAEAGAILAASSRKASAKAKAANPRLKRVKG